MSSLNPKRRGAKQTTSYANTTSNSKLASTDMDGTQNSDGVSPSPAPMEALMGLQRKCAL